MAGLLAAVQNACLARKCGAKVVQEPAGDVLVYDCPQWGPDNAMLLRLVRPHAEVWVRSSCTSLSGFVVVVREPPNPSAAARVGVALAALCAGVAALLLLLLLKPASPPPQ